MAIPYSLALRLAKPGFPEKGNKTYPVAQYYQLLDLGKMAAHMAGHASKYCKGDIMAVTTELTSCIREQLLLGNKIQLILCNPHQQGCGQCGELQHKPHPEGEGALGTQCGIHRPAQRLRV